LTSITASNLIRLHLSALLFLSLLILGLGVAYAEKADRDKPLKIEADQLDYDDLKQLSVFTGRVSLVKGTIDIRGDRLEVRQDPDGFQYAVLTPVPGGRASYKQKRDIQSESVEGIAQRIEYDGKQDKIFLLGNAELKRFRSGVVSDEISGQRIVYENLTDKFSVDSKLGTAVGSGDTLKGSTATSPKSGLGSSLDSSGQGTISNSSGARVRAILSPVKPSEAKP
jgi:lipopolysaccharide export system protein LptA